MREDPRYYAILRAIEDMDADGTLVSPDTVLDEIVRRILAELDRDKDLEMTIGNKTVRAKLPEKG